jgi:hypothetical protein
MLSARHAPPRNPLSHQESLAVGDSENLLAGGAEIDIPPTGDPRKLAEPDLAQLLLAVGANRASVVSLQEFQHRLPPCSGFTQGLPTGGILCAEPLFLVFQKVIQSGEGFESWALAAPVGGCPVVGLSHLVPAVLVIVAVDAEKFPVAAVGRIVVVIVIFVMDRELVEALSVELAPALGANPGKELECTLSVAGVALGSIASCGSDDPALLFSIWRRFSRFC